MQNPIERFAALSPEAQGRAIASLPPADQRKVFDGLKKLRDHVERTKFARMFPDTGPLRRELYPHHVQFFADGAWAQQRAFIAGNGAGKTQAGGYEWAAHLTGDYPKWWPGYKFNRPILSWIGGDTTKTVRDIIQLKLFGTSDHRETDKWGTGIIPAAALGKPRPSNQLPGLVDWVPVKSINGGWSKVYLKSYEQGREAWQGNEVDAIWLDEQPPTPIFEESVSRFRGESRDGRLIMTFTGLGGATDVVLLFLPELTDKVDEQSMRAAGRARVVCPIDDVPHMTAAEVAMKLSSYSGMARETRRTGIPYAGSGRVYVVDEDAFVVEPFDIPAHFALIAGADFGYGSDDGSGGTAVLWGAYDRQQDTVYIFDEYFRAQAEAPAHAAALKKHGDWVPVEGDYAGVAISETGRGKVIDVYKKLGVDIRAAEKDVEAGIRTVETRLSESKLKIFRTCGGTIQEYRMYNRNEMGRIIKKNDHRLDALRYLVMGLRHAKTKPVPRPQSPHTGTVELGFHSRRR